MKKTLLIASLAIASTGAMAQMPDNSICPDWTGTDLNGVTYNLYSLLDSGYTVFIDVSATWCGPCWAYHNTHALKNLYDQYGPGTAQNKVRVFFIEGDGSTTLADLQGTGSNTQGNWIAGTTYPIIDNASIGNLLQINYFPTIYKVCPNRLITEVGQINTTQLWNSVGSCQQAVSANDGTLLPALGSVRACQGSGVDLTARLQNLGTSPMTSATIQALQGSTVLGSTNWTGNLNTYDVIDVPVTNYIAMNSSTITYQITSTDDNTSNNSSTQSLATSNTIAPSTNVTFEIKTDNYGSETRWKLFNPDGTVFAQAGPYANGSQPAHTYNWTLNDLTCYRLQVTDAYGDGMCCSYGNGYYKVMVDGNIVLQGGQFSSEDNKLFKTDAISGIASNELDRSLNIYPNPSTGLVNIEYNLEQNTAMKVTVTDVVGQVVMSRELRAANSAQRQTLDLGDLSNGMYLIKMDAGNRQATRTITLNK
jgi:hypothetical protein